MLACKLVSFDRRTYSDWTKFKDRVLRETGLLKWLDHVNIVKYHDMAWINENEVEIYTEYLEDGNLRSYISDNQRQL